MSTAEQELNSYNKKIWADFSKGTAQWDYTRTKGEQSGVEYDKETEEER
jgi:hypothetical protein